MAEKEQPKPPSHRAYSVIRREGQAKWRLHHLSQMTGAHNFPARDARAAWAWHQVGPLGGSSCKSPPISIFAAPAKAR